MASLIHLCRSEISEERNELQTVKCQDSHRDQHKIELYPQKYFFNFNYLPSLRKEIELSTEQTIFSKKKGK